jgi:hypothetical protein
MAKPVVKNKKPDNLRESAEDISAPQVAQSPAPEQATNAASNSAVAAAVTATMLDPDMTMAFPAEATEGADATTNKDHLINDHHFRIKNKRRFLMDALCRALDTDMYVLEVDKQWAPNPLGRGPLVSIRYTREFPKCHIMFDKFSVMPDPKILEFKQRLAHERGYRYLYETPEKLLTHERLTELLDAQQDVVYKAVSME